MRECAQVSGVALVKFQVAAGKWEERCRVGGRKAQTEAQLVRSRTKGGAQHITGQGSVHQQRLQPVT